MTWLSFINFFFLQWFFVRIARCERIVIEEAELKNVSITSEGVFPEYGNIKTYTEYWFSLQVSAVPFSGWGKWPFVFLAGNGKGVYLRFTKRFKKNERK